MYNLNEGRRERVITFPGVKLDKQWSLKHFQQLAFQIAVVKIIMNFENNCLVEAHDGLASPALRVSGEIWVNSTCVMCGQIQQALLDTDLRYNHRFQEICSIWLHYNMNDKSPGTAEQMQILEDARAIGQLTAAQLQDADACRDYLASVGMLVDLEHEYGAGTVPVKIPDGISQRVWTI